MPQLAPQPPQPAQPKNSYWWFILGREPELSTAEIAAVLRFKKAPQLDSELPIMTCASTDIDPKVLITQLGGTMKIAEEIAKNMSTQVLISTVVDSLKSIPGKIHFGLSGYGKSLSRESITRIGMAIKKNLKNAGLSVRYVSNNEVILSSATVDHNQLVTKGREFIIREDGKNNFSLAYTVALQPYEEFSERDFGRPGRDNLSGMLPPKLAMMMINLARLEKNQVLYDPFCGSGTIVTEAMLLGYNHIIGSDLSPQAVSDTQKNIAWLSEKYNLSNQNIKVFLADATENNNQIKNQSIDAIVAETYLGKPLRGTEEIRDLELQADELRMLYEKTFKNFSRIIKPAGRVVFIFPAFRTPTGWIRTECAKYVESLGFEIDGFGEGDYLLYERSNQKLGREIWRFKKVS